MHISYGYDNNYVSISAVCVPTIPDRLHYVYIFLVNTNYLALFKPSAKPYEGPAKLLKTPSNIFVLDATLYARPSKPKPTETYIFCFRLFGRRFRTLRIPAISLLRQ